LNSILLIDINSCQQSFCSFYQTLQQPIQIGPV
jgi:hypothetical protein